MSIITNKKIIAIIIALIIILSSSPVFAISLKTNNTSKLFTYINKTISNTISNTLTLITKNTNQTSNTNNLTSVFNSINSLSNALNKILKITLTNSNSIAQKLSTLVSSNSKTETNNKEISLKEEATTPQKVSSKNETTKTSKILTLSDAIAKAGNSTTIKSCIKFACKLKGYSGLGSANEAIKNAKSQGLSTGTLPKTDSIIIIKPGAKGVDGTYGHAAYVTSVNNNTITIVESNYSGGYNERTFNPVETYGKENVQYIY